MTHDEDFEPWTLLQLTDSLATGHPDQDGRVVREVTRRMAEQLPDVKALDPLHLAKDLSHTMTAVASIANDLVARWLSDLDDEDMPDGSATLVERLLACAGDFQEISGSF